MGTRDRQFLSIRSSLLAALGFACAPLGLTRMGSLLSPPDGRSSAGQGKENINHALNGIPRCLQFGQDDSIRPRGHLSPFAPCPKAVYSLVFPAFFSFSHRSFMASEILCFAAAESFLLRLLPLRSLCFPSGRGSRISIAFCSRSRCAFNSLRICSEPIPPTPSVTLVLPSAPAVPPPEPRWFANQSNSVCRVL